MVRPGPPESVLSSAASWRPIVSSWLGGSVLADVVPAIGGKVTWTVRQQVQANLELTVAGVTVENGRTRRWRPSGPRDPLARFGQVLDVSLMVEGVLVRLGRFQITDWRDGSGNTIEVSGAGMLQAVADDRLQEATGPRDDGTLRSEFARLVPPFMTARFDTGLIDRECPKAMEWDQDRLRSLYEIADAWPARLREDPWGSIVVLPVLPDVPAPALTLADGEGGTVIGAPTSDTRDGSYNVFVARSSASGVVAQAVAMVTDGPMNANGDYLPVPKFFSSPLLLDEAQCLAAATTMRDESVRASRIRKVELVPDPRIEIDDAIELVLNKGLPTETREWGYVVGVEMPLTISDGSMRVDVTSF